MNQDKHPSAEELSLSGSNKEWLTISEMAQTCHTNRQTLIYYDRHDIFKPDYTDEKGYRYYSVYQVPFLREICVLKENNLSPKDIVDNFKNRNISNTRELLLLQKEHLQQDIDALNKKMENINSRLAYYDYVEEELEHSYMPYIRQFPERHILFAPWNSDRVNRSVMHFTHMKLRNMLLDAGYMLNNGWGALISKDGLLQKTPYKGSGGYVNLPEDFINNDVFPEENLITMPAGFYVCICRYCMPYETNYYYDLYDWLTKNHYEMTGDIINECMLDTTFYTQHRHQDLGLIQIPINLPGIKYQNRPY